MGKQKNINTTILLIGLLFLTFSCTVTKRHHNKGFHVEWRKNYWNKKQVIQAKVDTTKQSIAVISDEISLVVHTSDNTETPMLSVNKPEFVVSSTSEQKSSKQQNISHLQNKIFDNQIKKKVRKKSYSRKYIASKT